MYRIIRNMCAFGFGSGLSPYAPGTIGTLYAWILYFFLIKNLEPIWIVFLLLISIIVGLWSCGKTNGELGISDHGSIVLDEFIAFWLILFICMPISLIQQFIVFLLFRFFDILKPGFIGCIDQYFKKYHQIPKKKFLAIYPIWLIDGFGLIVDDIAAAFATLLVIAILTRFSSFFFLY